jgi:hypothetical protein
MLNLVKRPWTKKDKYKKDTDHEGDKKNRECIRNLKNEIEHSRTLLRSTKMAQSK